MMSSSKIDLVLFGARGDLSRRKLFPALYQLDKADLLSDDTRIAAVARQELETVDFVEQMGETLKTNLGDDWDDKIWSRFKKRIEYIRIEFSKKEQFNALREWSDESRTLIFYMATPPSMFGIICQHLDEANCIDSKARIVLEKPIGHDLESSKEVNDTVGEFFSESSIYRHRSLPW
jgi:glucose-6-phosphate 1-dehydrogenase